MPHRLLEPEDTPPDEGAPQRKKWIVGLDPRTGVMVVMGWSFMNMAAFIVQSDAQTRPVFTVLAKLHMPNRFYALAMCADLCALTISLLPIKGWIRAVTAALSSTVWLTFGLLIFASHEGSYIIVGLFSMYCALACTLAAAQWARWD